MAAPSTYVYASMPVILTTPDEWHAWLNLLWDQARALQRPLPDGVLNIL